MLKKREIYGFGFVYQISWVRDITRSNVDDFARNSSRRLLKLGLTDGHSETAAIEYSYIPSIPDDVVPGTKVLSLDLCLLSVHACFLTIGNTLALSFDLCLYFGFSMMQFSTNMGLRFFLEMRSIDNLDDTILHN